MGYVVAAAFGCRMGQDESLREFKLASFSCNLRRPSMQHCVSAAPWQEQIRGLDQRASRPWSGTRTARNQGVVCCGLRARPRRSATQAGSGGGGGAGEAHLSPVGMTRDAWFCDGAEPQPVMLGTSIAMHVSLEALAQGHLVRVQAAQRDRHTNRAAGGRRSLCRWRAPAGHGGAPVGKANGRRPTGIPMGKKRVPRDRIELSTRGFSVHCSTD